MRILRNDLLKNRVIVLLDSKLAKYKKALNYAMSDSIRQEVVKRKFRDYRQFQNYMKTPLPLTTKTGKEGVRDIMSQIDKADATVSRKLEVLFHINFGYRVEIVNFESEKGKSYQYNPNRKYLVINTRSKKEGLEGNVYHLREYHKIAMSQQVFPSYQAQKKIKEFLWEIELAYRTLTGCPVKPLLPEVKWAMTAPEIKRLTALINRAKFFSFDTETKPKLGGLTYSSDIKDHSVIFHKNKFTMFSVALNAQSGYAIPLSYHSSPCDVNINYQYTFIEEYDINLWNEKILEKVKKKSVFNKMSVYDKILYFQEHFPDEFEEYKVNPNEDDTSNLLILKKGLKDEYFIPVRSYKKQLVPIDPEYARVLLENYKYLKDNELTDFIEDVIFAEFKEVFNKRDNKVLIWNAPFDINSLMDKGFDIKCEVECGVRLAYLHHTKEPNDLKFNISKYFPELAGYEKDIDYTESDLYELLAPYAVIDTVLALRLKYIYESMLLDEPKQYRMWRNGYKELTDGLWTLIENQGLNVDLVKLSEVEKMARAELKEVEDQVFQVPSFNKYNQAYVGMERCKKWRAAIKRRDKTIAGQIQKTKDKIEEYEQKESNIRNDNNLAKYRVRLSQYENGIYTDSKAILNIIDEIAKFRNNTHESIPTKINLASSAQTCHYLYWTEEREKWSELVNKFETDYLDRLDDFQPLYDLLKIEELGLTEVDLEEYKYAKVIDEVAQTNPLIKKRTNKVDDAELETRKIQEEYLASMDKKSLEEIIMDTDSFIPVYVEYKGIEHLLNNYIIKFKRRISSRNTVHPNYGEASTGRKTCKNPNLQNLPERSKFPRIVKLIGEYKKIFFASEGYGTIAIDLSQAELRINSDLAGTKVFLDAYNNGVDCHIATMCMLYDKPLEWYYQLLEENPKEAKRLRNNGKGANFSLIFLTSWIGYWKAANTIYGANISKQEAKRQYDKFFEDKPELLAYFRQQEEFVKANGYVETFFGLRTNIPDIYHMDRGKVNGAIRCSVNYPTQGGQGFWTPWAMYVCVLRMKCLGYTYGEDFRYVNSVHDSQYSHSKYSVMQRLAKEAIIANDYPLTEEYFGFKLKCPMVSDLEVGTSNGHLTELDLDKFLAIPEVGKDALTTIYETSKSEDKKLLKNINFFANLQP